MNDNDKRINVILSYLAKAASTAVEGVNEAVHSAGNAVGDKYNNFKLGIELSRLKAEQTKMFEDLGRTLFMVKTGAFGDGQTVDGEEITGQETVDKLLALAEEKQAEIDAISQQIEENCGDIVCPVCGKVALPEDVFCSACGTKLPEPQPEEACDCEEDDEIDENEE